MNCRSIFACWTVGDFVMSAPLQIGLPDILYQFES